MKQVKVKRKHLPLYSALRRDFEEAKKAGDEVMQYQLKKIAFLKGSVKLLNSSPDENTIPNKMVAEFLEEMIFDKERIIEMLQSEARELEEALKQVEYEESMYKKY